MRIIPADSHEPYELRQFRPRLLAALPELATAFLTSPDQERSALVIRDTPKAEHDPGFVFRIFPLAQGPGTAALQILEQLSETPRRVAALISAYRIQTGSTPHAEESVQLSATLATFGVHRFYLEHFWGHPHSAEVRRGGVIEIGASEPLHDDERHFALDCSLIL